jgi:NAD(P)-dependent dehydrogenase (short-subunit alcohol dehydrogenase family)
MDLGLTDRAAIVTGGSRGIGLQISRRLCAEGARVLLVGRGEDALRAAVAELGEHAAWIAADITAADAGERVVADCRERFGRVDVLVNNAGGNDHVALPDLDDDEYRAQFDVHVMAPMRFMRAAIPAMLERGWGRVVNVVSTSGRRPGTNNLAYGVSKAAELSLSRGFAEHYAAHGVLVNAVNPGPIEGELWHGPGGLADQLARARGTTRDAVLDSITAGLPLGRMGTREDIADVVAFLCSERIGNVVGAAWSADSGAVASIF